MNSTRKLLPNQKILGLGDITLGDFWAWAYSDVLSNTVRPLFAEYMVGLALNCVDHPRIEWNAVDFEYRSYRIEVKSSAYLQTWSQSGPSLIRFDIAKKIPWDAATNQFGSQAMRSADCYIFCVYPEVNRDRCNVLDVDAWDFYVLSCSEINQTYEGQKTLSLARLKRLVKPVRFSQLRESVDRVLGLHGENLSASGPKPGT